MNKNKLQKLNILTLADAIRQVDTELASRAEYGDKLLSSLAKKFAAVNISNCNRRQLYEYLRFYRVYPQIVQTVSAQFQHLLPARPGSESEKVQTASALSINSADTLTFRLSWSMFSEKICVHLRNLRISPMGLYCDRKEKIIV